MIPDPSPKAREIVGHARALLAAGGYNGFSYADIAERVGITKASIHHHFASKAELVRVVVVLYREEARQGLAAVDGAIAAPKDRLLAYANYWSECLAADASAFCVCAMLASERPAIPDDVAREVAGHFDDLRGWLAAVLAAGEARGDFRLSAPAGAEAATLMATVHGAMLSSRAAGDAALFPAIVLPAIERLSARA